MKQEISKQVQNWILEEELPPKAILKPINKFDGLYPESEEERQAYWDFTMFLNLYSLSWLRWKQVSGANGGSP